MYFMDAGQWDWENVCSQPVNDGEDDTHHLIIEFKLAAPNQVQERLEAKSTKRGASENEVSHRKISIHASLRPQTVSFQRWPPTQARLA
jgi:hypothetical protein